MKIKEIKEMLLKLEQAQNYIIKSKDFFKYLDEIFEDNYSSIEVKLNRIDYLYKQFKKEVLENDSKTNK